jgi:hypothetical protein
MPTSAPVLRMSEMRLTNFAVEIVIALACAVLGWPTAGAQTPPSSPPARAEPSKSPEGFAAKEGAGLPDGWRLVRTPNPYGGAAAISIMRTAEMARSDPGLAGLTVRCSEHGAEVLIVLLRAFTPQARPQVVLSADGTVTRVQATVASPGAALLLPQEAAALVNGPWRSAKELSIKVEDPEGVTGGVVSLAGLGQAYRVLIANCGADVPPR